MYFKILHKHGYPMYYCFQLAGLRLLEYKAMLDTFTKRENLDSLPRANRLRVFKKLWEDRSKIEKYWSTLETPFDDQIPLIVICLDRVTQDKVKGKFLSIKEHFPFEVLVAEIFSHYNLAPYGYYKNCQFFLQDFARKIGLPMDGRALSTKETAHSGGLS